MPEVNVDSAFEWLMVIIGIVFAIVSQYPELYWTGNDPMPPAFYAARQLVFPLLVIAFIWLAGKLVINKNIQVAVKLVAWMIALAVAIMNIYMWAVGSFFMTEYPLVEGVFLVLGFVVNPVFVYGIVVPRYKRDYPTSTFLKSKIKLLMVYIVFLVFVLVSILFG